MLRQPSALQISSATTCKCQTSWAFPALNLPLSLHLPDRLADIGMEEGGVADAIVAAVQAVHPHVHALLYSNILLTGAPRPLHFLRMHVLCNTPCWD